MCDLLASLDNKIIQVALDGLENILKVGEMDKESEGPGATNKYAAYIEEAGGMVAIHNLQHHQNLEIYKKCFFIMDSEPFLFTTKYDGVDVTQSSSRTKKRKRQKTPLRPSTSRVNTHSSLTVSCVRWM